MSDKPQLIIVGAGMAGLLAANMLRRMNPVVIESQPTLPNNHSALLRFRSPAVGDAIGIAFKKVLVHKGIWDGEKVVNQCTIPLANQYSERVAGAYLDRSIWNLEPEFRYIAPDDFIERMAQGVNVHLGTNFILHKDELPTISTIPMPRMAINAEGSFTKAFEFTDIVTMKAKMECRSEIYQTIYNGSTRAVGSWYRASVHGDELTVEFSGNSMNQLNPESFSIGQVFGIDCFVQKPIVKVQRFGKIKPINEVERHNFILHLTDKYNTYSLGRFATWRNILMDDCVKDVKVIEHLIKSDSKYLNRKHNTAANS